MAEKDRSNIGFAQRSETWLAVAMLVMLIVLIIPLPTPLLDMLLAVNLAAGVMLLLIVLGAKQPLDVSVFPSVLLLLTLFRLSLNVSTTRLILLNADAGKIVTTFGDFVVGGNLVVGIVIFLILVTIQFIVITKGATRISEVNARFTLDAMPGKQMAIDAELSTGAINEKEAKTRREKLTSEAEFYGAMDGASKYVRGDAIAGLIIMVVNIIGGVVLGVSNGLPVADALQLYSILTIGDGLVSQIPALVIATSAGILVTKSSSDTNLGDEIGIQFSKGYRSLYAGAFIMLIVSLTPGFPKLPFLLIGSGLLFFVNYIRQQETGPTDLSMDEEGQTVGTEPELSPEEKSLQEFLKIDRVVVEIGAGLISIVEPKKGKGIAARIRKLRENMASQHGFWIPQARIRDNLQMGVNEYRFIVSGREVGRGDLMLDRNLAINPGEVQSTIDGLETTDPAFGLKAIWIEEVNRRRAEQVGYTVVDAPTVLITHLGECLRLLAHELLSREDVNRMLEKLKEFAPSTVDDIRSDSNKAGQFHQLLVNLLAEGIPITSLEKIVESAAYFGSQAKTVNELTELVRGNIGHLICEPFRGEDGRVQVIILEPKLEHHFRQSVNGQTIALAPNDLESLVTHIQKEWDTCQLRNQSVALLVDSTIRAPLRHSIYRSLKDVNVIAYSEIPDNLVIDAKRVIRFEEVISNGDPTNTNLISDLISDQDPAQ